MNTLDIGNNFYIINLLNNTQIQALVQAINDKYDEFGYLPTRIVVDNEDSDKYSFLITGSDNVSDNNIIVSKVDFKGSNYSEVLKNEEVGPNTLWAEIIFSNSPYKIIDEINISVEDYNNMETTLMNYINN